MIELKTVVERILVYADGSMSVRLGKQILDGGKILSNQPHLVSINPGDDVEQIMALNNAHLRSMGCAQCDDYSKVKAHADLAHDDKTVCAYRASLEERK